MWLDRRRFGIWCLAVVAVLTASAQVAEAHGIAGNRYFPGTPTFDDRQSTLSPTLFAKPAFSSQPLVSRVKKFPN
jgi:hypothetical protein